MLHSTVNVPLDFLSPFKHKCRYKERSAETRRLPPDYHGHRFIMHGAYQSFSFIIWEVRLVTSLAILIDHWPRKPFISLAISSHLSRNQIQWRYLNAAPQSPALTNTFRVRTSCRIEIILSFFVGCRQESASVWTRRNILRNGGG